MFKTCVGAVAVAAGVAAASPVELLAYHSRSASPLPAGSSYPGLSGHALVRGSGLEHVSAGTHASIGFDASDFAGAFAGEDYLQFGFTVWDGFEVDLETISFRYDRTVPGPTGLALIASADATFASYTTIFTDDSIADRGETHVGLSLASLDLVRTDMYFRIYAWGGSNGVLDLENDATLLATRAIVFHGGIGAASVVPLPGAGAAGLSGLAALAFRRRRAV